VALDLRAARPVRFEELAPALSRWTLRSLDPAGRAVQVERPAAVLPERRFAVSHAEQEMRVDGVLDEWVELPFRFDSAGESGGPEPADASARFDVRQDGAYFYIGVDVTDDSVVASETRRAHDQDSVSVSIDARSDPERSANESYSAARRSGALRALLTPVITLVEPSADPAAPAEGGEDRAAERLRSAAQRTARGYSVELAVPHALLDERQGGPWQALRLNVAVADVDPDASRTATFTWRPTRFGPLAVEGSGTFVRP
jgi:hypothetical protein